MKTKDYSVHIIFTTIHSALAIVTLLPAGFVSKSSLLGYKSLCSFSPISTLILVALAGLHFFLHKRSIAIN